MKKNIINIGTIGHIDHGRTTLTACIAEVLKASTKETKTLQEMINEEKTQNYTITTLRNDFPQTFIESGKVGKGGRARNRSKYGKR